MSAASGQVTPTGGRSMTGEGAGESEGAARRRDARYDGATDEQVAETILADLNYKRLPYERALIVTTAHVRGIRAAALRAGAALERVVLDVLYGHQYDTRDRGGRPDDPGWHVCSCGWEGYWCDWQPHVAERIANRLTVKRLSD